MFPCIQGITYDTGGADIKHGGSMAGMHRDKCGAAFVAGFFQVVNVYKCKKLQFIHKLTSSDTSKTAKITKK